MMLDIYYSEPCFFKAVKQVCNSSIFNTLTFEISCNEPTDKLLLFHGHCMKLTYTFPGCAMLQARNFYISCAYVQG